ncbi:hypothetical protein KDI_38030 [Dictyobacter arantiisoli]|uniref:Uncharacterized protein n=2 Tax=Dictyobacter arantiisoli TaxID=2014874 RepID=A0A5A5TGT3_9CHLR|nr:hypothetical protein KDI_38030 [Dictyobacter arantiisoli]
MFLTDGEFREKSLTYAELHQQACYIGSFLQDKIQPGDRVLLLYPPGGQYIAAIFGCFYAGAIAIPAYPPKMNHNLERIEAILHDAQITVALTTQPILTSLRNKFADHDSVQNIRWIATDEQEQQASEQDWKRPKITNETVAMLQYTSGSTGSPKGVIVTHNNLIHNAAFIQKGMRLRSDSSLVSWLPPYHDMGLMGGILEAVYLGVPITFMPPAAFLQQPLRWLRAISRYHAKVSGAPNFAFDLCVNKATPENIAELDLSSWELAFSGAEPIRQQTLERFARTFAPCGFRPEAFYPCYGLAEATLFAAGSFQTNPAQRHYFDASAIEQGQVIVLTAESAQSRSLVSSGYTTEGQKIEIVDPEHLTRCAPNQIGEIWLAGPNIAQGYWNKPLETMQTFQGYLKGSHEGPFLRTGDLGFSLQGELFITGRLKDVIIIRGRNLYPQDIEAVVESSHPALRQNCCAAFSLSDEQGERLIITQEIERHHQGWEKAAIIQAIRQKVTAEFDIEVASIVLLRAGTILKTTSGKIQRSACRQSFLAENLNIVYQWDHKTAPLEPVQLPDASQPIDERKLASLPLFLPNQASSSTQTIVNWIRMQIAQRTHLDPRDIDPSAPFVNYGLDSVAAVSLSGDLEQWLQRSLSPTLIYDYPSIDTLAHYLANPTSHKEQPQKDDTASVYTHQTQSIETDAIAIIGFACRFPQALNAEAFWQLLHDGVDAISEVPDDRWSLDTWYQAGPTVQNKMNTRWGGFLHDVDQFDPTFFEIAPREAAKMDPQQRLLLEIAWETFEHAAIAPDTLAGSQTGVFIGISSNDYLLLQQQNSTLDAYVGTGNAHSIAANRLSYAFDLRGPSMAVDSACSSSLLALHQACQSIRAGECSLALAGGVNLLLTPEPTLTFSQAHMMSPDGHCKTFDETADGYVRGEGCGLVLLKPLAAAQRDGDRVFALIRGSATNQDGASNGLTAPNGPAQEMVIRQALINANIHPEQLSYIETHGTGTSLGDPIEVNALKNVLLPQRNAQQLCLLGAVKTNIGHLEAAAGIAGVIKTILSFLHQEIPANLHFQKLNPHIQLEGTPLQLATKRQPWPKQERQLAGVSAFGFGGTNVHLILEAAPDTINENINTKISPELPERPQHLLTLSAKSPEAFALLAQRYITLLQQQHDWLAPNIAFSANTGRKHFAYRKAFSFSSHAQLLSQLQEAAKIPPQNTLTAQISPPKIAFLFSGQGTQYAGMAKQLYETQPTFRQELERCDGLLRDVLEYSLIDILYGHREKQTLLDETQYTQPVLFSLEYALAMLWRSWGVEPDIVMGHSIGEYVAACIAGILSLEDALKLVTTRGRLMQALPQHGTMLTVLDALSNWTDLLTPFQQTIAIAAINGPQNIVLSGAETALHTVEQHLKLRGIATRSLHVSHAFHSPLLDPILDNFEQYAHTIPFQPARIPLVSNLTGEVIAIGSTLDAHYWRRHTRETVQFAAGIHTLVEQDTTHFIELGPHTTLITMAQIGLVNAPEKSARHTKCHWYTTLHKEQENWHTLLATVADLYTQGVKINWRGFDQDYQRQRVTIPNYPFIRQRYWLTTSPKTLQEERTTTQSVSGTSQSRHPFLDRYQSQRGSDTIHIWESQLDVTRLPQLQQHRIQGIIALPMFTYVEIALAAAAETFGHNNYRLHELQIAKLLFLADKGTRKIQFTLEERDHQQLYFQLCSHLDTPGTENEKSTWTLHATGKLQLV